MPSNSAPAVVPPPLPSPKASYTWIWKWVKPGSPISVMGCKFYLEQLAQQTGRSVWAPAAPEHMVEIPVRLVVPDNGLHQEIPIYDPTSSVTMVKTEQDWIRAYWHMNEVLQKAYAEHKKQWENERAQARKARKDWEKKYPEAAAKLLEEQEAKKLVKHTQAIIDFIEPLTKARSAIESMLLAIDRGTYNGKMCADLYYAVDAVSTAQKTFRRKCCGGKKKK